MNTKSLTTSNNPVWNELNLKLSSRLASALPPTIDQRQNRHSRFIFQHQITTNCQLSPSSSMSTMNGKNMNGHTIRGDTLDDDRDLTSKRKSAEEDGASCYLCTHCGKGYDSVDELDTHLLQIRNDLHLINRPRIKTDTTTTTSSIRGNMDEEGDDEDFDEDVPLQMDEDIISDEEEIFDGRHHNGGGVESVKMERSASTNDASIPIDRDNTKKQRAYSCKFCSKLFDSNSALNVHYTHTHRDKPQYECDLCGRVYGVKRELATHRRLHDGQPTHRCRQCGKEFGTKQLLRKHELWHTGERSHVCPQCGKAFFQKGHLTQHMMIHAGGRPHACHLCQKTFIFKFDLNRHMKIHAERVGNAEECSPINNEQSSNLVNDLMTKSISYESGGTGGELESIDLLNGAHDPNETTRPLSVDTLFPSTSSTSTNVKAAVIQQLNHSGNPGGHEISLAHPFGLLRTWTPSQFMDAQNQNDQQQRVALAAAFAQALCQAQQHATLFANFSATSPPLSNLFNNFDQQQQLQQQHSIGMINGDQRLDENSTTTALASSEHDSTSGSSPAATLDEHHRESASMTESPPPIPTCVSCREFRQRLDISQKRIQELEHDLSQRRQQVDNLQTKIQRCADVASRLLESCSDFDKLWMLHSKQIYSQIQTILNALD